MTNRKDLSFNKKLRIKAAGDFRYVFVNGKTIRSRSYKCKYLENNSTSRLGIIVTKKIGNAVVRNYEKRLPKIIGYEQNHHHQVKQI